MKNKKAKLKAQKMIVRVIAIATVVLILASMLVMAFK